MTRPDVEVSNVDKVLYPDDNITKGDLLDYYRDLAGAMAPHLRDRPLTMRRFPDGIGRSGFFQQAAADYFPDWIATVEAPQRGGGVVRHVLAQDAQTLRYLANQACLEFHVWLSRADRLDCPDRLVIDLDPPADGVDLAALRDSAQLVTDVYTDLGLVPFAQTTGGRGYHLTSPLDAEADFAAVRALARDIAELLVAESPELVTNEQRKARRGDRIFLDTNRNAYGQTAVAPYSLRARPGAPAATPISLDELRRVGPDRYGLHNLRRRLAGKADPWTDLERHAGSARDARRRLDKLTGGRKVRT